MAFTSLADTAFDVCFENTLTGRGMFPFPLPLPSHPRPALRCVLAHSRNNKINPLTTSVNPTVSSNQQVRHVELDIDIGADARDWSAIQAQEKLKPVDTELRRIEASVNEIVQEMEYLRIREQKLRDTNESTNERVKWFALGTMGMLVGLGAWQVVYLRAYFRYVSCSVPFSSWRRCGHLGPRRLRKCFGYLGLTLLFLQIEASHLDV